MSLYSCLKFYLVIAVFLFGCSAACAQSHTNLSVGVNYFGNKLIQSPGVSAGVHYKYHSIIFSSAIFFDSPRPNQIINTLNTASKGLNMLGIGYRYGFQFQNFIISPGIHIFRNFGLNYRKVDFFDAGPYFIYRRELTNNFSAPVSISVTWKRLQGQLIYNYQIERLRIGMSYLLFKR